MSEKFAISAIDPNSGELVMATLISDHFSKGKSAIKFGSALNSPYYSADKIEWEFSLAEIVVIPFAQSKLSKANP